MYVIGIIIECYIDGPGIRIFFYLHDNIELENI